MSVVVNSASSAAASVEDFSQVFILSTVNDSLTVSQFTRSQGFNTIQFSNGYKVWLNSNVTLNDSGNGFNPIPIMKDDGTPSIFEFRCPDVNLVPQIYNTRTNRMVHACISDNSYPVVNLKGFKSLNLHTMIANYYLFNPEPESRVILHHMNSNTLDNRIPNMAWVTSAVNNAAENQHERDSFTVEDLVEGGVQWLYDIHDINFESVQLKNPLKRHNYMNLYLGVKQVEGKCNLYLLEWIPSMKAFKHNEFKDDLTSHIGSRYVYIKKADNGSKFKGVKYFTMEECRMITRVRRTTFPMIMTRDFPTN